MAPVDPKKLFDILDEGFDGLESGITDKTLRMEMKMRMDKMRQRIKEDAKKTRHKINKRFEDLDKRREEILTHDYEEVPDRKARRQAMKHLKFMMVICFLLFFFMGLIFLWGLADQRQKETSQTPPPLSPPAVEETVNKRL